MKALFVGRRLLSICVALAFLFIVLTLTHRHRYIGKAILTNHPNEETTSFLTGIAVDDDGNIYVAAQKQNRILKISAARHVMPFAGDGRMDFGGDGGPANQASLASPVSIALDSADNLFIADTGNNRIRRVDAKTHTITTVAGNGSFGSGDGVSATATGFYQPISIAVDADGNLYVGGVTFTPGIRRVDAITRISAKIIGGSLPGNPSAPEPSAGPFWLTVDEHGSLLFSDPSRNAVSMINVPGNDPHVIAGSALCGFAGDGGPAIGALLCFPEALAVSRDKRLFIADTGNNRIRQVDLRTGIITTVAGDGQPSYGGDGGPAVDGRLKGPMGIALDNKGDLYIADTGNNCIRRLDVKTQRITTWATARNLEVSFAK
jgi:sugar lactone lactonase YvrE